MSSLFRRGVARLGAVLRALGALVAAGILVLLPARAGATLHVVTGLDPEQSFDLYIEGQLEETGLRPSQDGLLCVATTTRAGHHELVSQSPEPGLWGGPLAASPLHPRPRLVGAHPNPIRDGGALLLEASTSAEVTIEAYDVRGRWAGILWEGVVPNGRSRIRLAPRIGTRGLPAGVYWVRAVSSGQPGPYRKLVLLP